MTDKCDLREQLNMTIRYARRLQHDLERREALMEKATAASSQMGPAKVKASAVNRYDIIITAMADLDVVIDGEIEYLDYLKNRNKSIFEESDLTADELEVMMRRYVDCLEWEEIAELLYWSKRHVQRLHGDALAKLVTRWHAMSSGDRGIV